MLDTRRTRILVSALLLAAVAEFVVRGPVRLLTVDADFNDFLSPYIQARVWMTGKNPYSARELVALWPSSLARPVFVDRDAANGVLAKRRGIPTPYPPTTFLLLCPFALLPWRVALWLWLVLSVSAVVASFLALLSIVGADWRDLRSQAFLAGAFALAPFHTGLANGNPSMLAVSLTVGVVWAARARRNAMAGILLALAICLKPQLGLCLLFYYVVRRHWRIGGVAAMTTALVAIGAGLRLAWAGTAWLPTYRENAAAIFGSGAVADFGHGRSRFTMLNLQVLLSSFSASRPLINALAIGCAGVLAAIWFWLCIRRRHHELLEIGAICVISLLPVYHQFYDAALLVWPLSWSMLIVRRRPVVLLTMALIAPFLVPGAAFLDQLTQRGRLPAALVDKWWWNAVVMPHAVWALLLLSLLLLYVMSVQVRASRNK